jgi:hypothetical protein
MGDHLLQKIRSLFSQAPGLYKNDAATIRHTNKNMGFYGIIFTIRNQKGK